MGTGLLVLATGIVFSFLGMILFAINKLKHVENSMLKRGRHLRLKTTRGYV